MQNDAMVGSPAESGRAGVGRYVFLGFILLLLAANIAFLAFFSHGRSDYGNLVICIMLLLNHISFHFAKQGRLSFILKTIARVWLVFAFCYVAWLIASGI